MTLATARLGQSTRQSAPLARSGSPSVIGDESWFRLSAVSL
jgi:hypothetical protein